LLFVYKQGAISLGRTIRKFSHGYLKSKKDRSKIHLNGDSYEKCSVKLEASPALVGIFVAYLLNINPMETRSSLYLSSKTRNKVFIEIQRDEIIIK
jgi:hypothetical protein